MIKKIIAIVLVLATIGVGTGIYLFYKKPETVDDKKGIVITAVTLSQQYTTNEKAADSIYLNKVIEVTGNVEETEQNQDGGMMVILKTDDPIAGIQCAMREKGVKVTKGQTTTIKGFCSGSGITGVSLTDCVISK
ncbi:MAG: OB-fold putative lipoprotein [Taibaiella sp.]|nr:OB-fold putative lipoprotein [Taibaiella sp.]